MAEIQSFNIIGIAVRTTNENGQSAKDIPALWNRFIAESVIQKIPNKIDQSIYCMYTDYEKDHTKPYTTIIGCKVSTLNSIPEGMMGKAIEGGAYNKFVARGNLMNGLVYDEWIKIWNAEIKRVFTADFEVYGDKAQNPEDAEVDIFVAIEKP